MRAESILDEAFTALIALAITVVLACALTGRSRATHYRRANPPALKADPAAVTSSTQDTSSQYKRR